MGKYHYNCPQGLLDGYESVFIDQHCRWKCFKGFGGCPSCINKQVLDIPGILEEIKNILSKNPGAKIFLDAPNFCEEDGQMKLPDSEIDQRDYLLRCITKKNAQAYFRLETTVYGLVRRSESYFDLLTKAGVKEIWAGMESADKNLRNQYSKPPFTDRELERVMRELRKCGIAICWYLVVGVIDTDTSINRTIRLIRRLKPARIYIIQAFGYEPGEQKVSLGRIAEKAKDIDRWWKELQTVAKELDGKFFPPA